MIITVFSFPLLFAQVTKNRWYGSVGLGRKIFYYNTNTVQTAVSVGLNEHSEVGVFYNYTRYNSSPSAVYGGRIITQGAGVSYRYYRHFKKSIKWGWYLEGAIAINRVSIYDKQPGSLLLDNRYHEGELAAAPGIFFIPSQRVLLYANLGSISVASNPYESFDVRSSFPGQLHIGARITIGNTHKKENKE